MSRERLQKLLAHAGVASRRKAEQLIAQGHVRVNGAVVTQLGSTASLEDDVIEVDGERITAPEALRWFAVNKPPGVVTTVRDPQRRPTVMRLLPRLQARLYPVGRLDVDSEGLLLLTNDGELAHKLTHPRFQVEKEYRAELDAPVDASQLARICEGVPSLGQFLRAQAAWFEFEDDHSRVRLVLAEGRKREVRRMFEALDRRVLRLTRVRFGPIELGELAPGRARELSAGEMQELSAATSD